jgi:hypothetical protein
MHPFKHAVPQCLRDSQVGSCGHKPASRCSYVMLFSGITLDGANGSLKADRWTPILRPLLTSHGGMVVIRRTPNA